MAGRSPGRNAVRLHAVSKIVDKFDRRTTVLLTRTGLDWTHKYPAIAAAVSSLGARQAYLDGELCGVGPDGITSFSMIQAASDAGNAAGLVFFLFDLLHLDGEDLTARPLIERKARLAALLADAASPLQYSDHQIGRGREFHQQACALSLEGIVSKRADAPYAPGNRGLWRKVKCLHREEFVVVGWTDPEGTAAVSRRAAARLLRSRTAGWSMPAAPAPASTRPSSNGCGIACSRSRPTRCRSRCRRRAAAASDRRWCLSRVHWVRPELVAEVKFLTWTEDNLLRQVVYEGLREDKPAAEVRRAVPYPKP